MLDDSVWGLGGMENEKLMRLPGHGLSKISHKFYEFADNVAYLQLFTSGGCSKRFSGSQVVAVQFSSVASVASW